MIGSLPQRLCRFDDLFRPSTDPIVFSQVQPTHSTRRIRQKLGRSCNVLSIFSRTCVDQVVAANHLRFWIRKKRECVPSLLTKIARDLWTVYADGYRTNPHFFKLSKATLNAPQL